MKDSRVLESASRSIQTFVEDAESNFDSLTRQIPVPFVYVDDDWRVVFITHQATELLEIDREHIVGEQVCELLPELRDTAFHENTAEARAKKEPRWFDGLYEPLGRWFTIWASPEENGLGIVFQDVTEWNKDTAKTAQSHALLDAVTGCSRDLIRQESADGVHKALEDAASEIFETAEFYRWDDGVLRSETDQVPPRDGAIWRAFSRQERVLSLPCTDDSPTGQSPKTATSQRADPVRRDNDRLELQFPVGNEGVLRICARDLPPKRYGRCIDALILCARARLKMLSKERKLADTARQLEDTNEKLRRLSKIEDIIRQLIMSIVEATDRDSIQNALCDTVMEIDQWEFGVFFEKNGEDVSVGCSRGEEEFARRLAEPLENSPLADSLLDGEVRITDDVARKSPSDWRRAVLDRGYLSVATVPVKSGDRVFGVLEIYSGDTEAFTGGYSDALVDVCAIAGYALTSVEQMESILSMGFNRITVRIQDDVRCFFSRLVDELGVDVWITAIVPGDNGRTVYFKTDAEEAAIRRVGEENGIDISATIGGYSATVPEMSVVEQALQVGGRVSRYAADSDSLLVDVNIPKGSDARDLVDAVSEAYSQVELAARKPREARQTAESHLDELTDRQRTVLRLAYEQGFFESPREVSGQDLADQMGITDTTLHQHLRVAERKLVDAVLSESDAEAG